jgi:hypothetical protein
MTSLKTSVNFHMKNFNPINYEILISQSQRLNKRISSTIDNFILAPSAIMKLR